MNARVLSDFLSMLVAVRTASVLMSPAARGRYYWDGGRVIGFLAALRVAEVISRDEESRMYGLFCNASEHSGEPFPNRLNAGPCIWLWDLRKRNEQAQEVVHVGPVEVPASRGLQLLCLLVPSRDGQARSLPVHTLHRVSPYKGLSGRYYDGARSGGVALDPLDLPGGTGLYLRQTHARPASAAVLARCLRQRLAHAFRADSRTVRTGGLNRG